MKILFIGGTGIISTACAKMCLRRGIDLYCLNRGQSIRSIPSGAKVISADYFDRAEVQALIGNEVFDVVVDWIAYHPEQVQFDHQFFHNKVGQYIFISSASAYETPPSRLPVTEETPLSNPFWEYSRNKISCEQYLRETYQKDGFPVTIVRPSHTYDHTTLPFRGGYMIIDRMRKGKKIIIHGDGTSLWTMTHADDFARGFFGLLGNQAAIGETFHITSDEWLTWNQLALLTAKAAGAGARIIHIPSEVIARFNADWGASLLGDKSHSMIFDNSKIKRFVPDYQTVIPFSAGIREVVQWYDADRSRQHIDAEHDQLIDTIIGHFEKYLLAGIEI